MSDVRRVLLVTRSTEAVKLAQELIGKADRSWEESQRWARRGTDFGDVEAAFWKGKYAAYCDAVGDQSGLALDIDQTLAADTAQTI